MNFVTWKIKQIRKVKQIKKVKHFKKVGIPVRLKCVKYSSRMADHRVRCDREQRRDAPVSMVRARHMSYMNRGVTSSIRRCSEEEYASIELGNGCECNVSIGG